MSDLVKQTALYIQQDPTQAPSFLTCYGVGAFTPGRPSVNVSYCPGGQFGQWAARRITTGEIATSTLDLNSVMNSVHNYILEQNCPAEYRVNWGCRGNRYVVTNYLLGLVILRAIFTTSQIPEAGLREPGAEELVENTGQLSVLEYSFVKRLAGARQGVTSTQGVNDISFLPEICADECNDYTGLGEEGYAVLDTDYLGVYGDTVLHTADGGGTWAATATSPFLVLGRNATSVVTMVTSSGHRVVVAGGAMPAAYPEISYSDDTGTIWYNIQIADVGGGGRGVNMLTIDPLGRIWAAFDDGRIYRSDDQAESWTVYEDGVETLQDLNDIVFYDENVGYAVGDAGVVLQTTDGETWDALTGPVAVGVNILSVAVNRWGHVFVTTNDTRLFRSVDEGDTWEELRDLAVGSINRIRFDPQHRYFGYMIWDNAGPVGQLLRSEDGGTTWRAEVLVGTTPTNAGLDAIFVCDPNMVYIGGEPQGGTSYIAKFIRQA